MSGSCKHQKRCGLLLLRLFYIFLNKIYKKKTEKKQKKNRKKHHSGGSSTSGKFRVYAAGQKTISKTPMMAAQSERMSNTTLL